MEHIVKKVLLYYCFLSSIYVYARNPIGLRAGSSLRGIPLGTAIKVANLRQYIDDGQYNAAIRYNYEVVVPEGELKPRYIWKGENTYYWDDADYLLGAPNTTGWVQQNLMKLRGHNLVWAPDACIPDWLIKNESLITPDKAKQLLSDYIHAVVGRYRGKIPWWDVVNEAIDERNNTNPLNLRNSFWLRKLGPDYIKYAFMFAQEADPDTQLYYNEYNIESVGLKQNRTLALINWLRSQGATVHGVGLQWHIDISMNITLGDGHYQSAQQFIDNRLDIMVTELDVALPTNGGYPINSQDLKTQGDAYREMLNYVLYFSPNCKAMLTWGFTDRYSWIPWVRNYDQGAALPLDWLYLPKPAYMQMLEILTHVVPGNVYRLSPESQPEKCLGVSQNTTSNTIQLYNDSCNSAYQQWNITWQYDGTYRFSSQSNNNRVLDAYNTTAAVGSVYISNWSGDANQEWAFSAQGNNTYHIVPRGAWWRVMSVYGTSNDIGIVDPSGTASQNWILTKV